VGKLAMNNTGEYFQDSQSLMKHKQIRLSLTTTRSSQLVSRRRVKFLLVVWLEWRIQATSNILVNLFSNYGLQYSCAAVNQISTDTARRAVRLR